MYMSFPMRCGGSLLARLRNLTPSNCPSAVYASTPCIVADHMSSPTANQGSFPSKKGDSHSSVSGRQSLVGSDNRRKVEEDKSYRHIPFAAGALSECLGGSFPSIQSAPRHFLIAETL